MKLARDHESLKAITGLIEYAFRKQQPIIDDPLFLSRYEHADSYGMYHDGELTSLVMANHFEIQLFNERVKMAGVGYVSSYPEYRGQGGVSNIMPELLTDLYEQGVAVSQLAPFSESFYRQFGYEPTSRRKIYRIPALAFNYLPSERRGNVKRGTWQQMKLVIQSIYQRLLKQQQNGTVIREDWWWERLDHYYSHRFYAVAYDDAGEAKGYIIYRMQGSTLIVDELAYENELALRKLLTYLKSHVSSFEEFLYYAPVHEIILEVTEDKECPWNVGSWLVSQGTCQKVHEAGDIKASIHEWSELLLGELTLAEGVFLGKVTAAKGFTAEIFPKGRQSFYDYF